MTWPNWLSGRAGTAPAPPPPADSCPHPSLGRRWGQWADIGAEDKIIGYTCVRCRQSFTAAEGRELQRVGGA